MHQLKLTIRKKNREQQSLAADSVYAQLSPSLQRCVDLARESGSSSWLTVLPIEEHAFHLHKGDFRDALSLRYGLMPLNTASTCHCGASFSVELKQILDSLGYLTIRILGKYSDTQ